jgi:hypothetical protein
MKPDVNSRGMLQALRKRIPVTTQKEGWFFNGLGFTV